MQIANPILNIDDEAYPEKYRGILRRLQKAAAEATIRHTMDGEDEILEEFESLERAIARKEETIERQNQALADKDAALEQYKREIEELRKRLQ